MGDARPPYKDPSQPVEARVEHLLGRMTLDEKIAQPGCLWSTALVSQGAFDPDFAAAKMPHGIGQITRGDFTFSVGASSSTSAPGRRSLSTATLPNTGSARSSRRRSRANSAMQVDGIVG